MPKLCLAASGGGHLRQILDLQPIWSAKEYVLVTEDTALGRSLAADHQVEFVEHFALGQAKLGHPWAMFRAALRNFRQSAQIVGRHRPDVVISTGAGAVFLSALIAKLRGARVILIDSFARFDRPSVFARLLRPFADETIVQSEGLGKQWPRAHVFDPFRILNEPPPPKEDLMFVTVGATLGFPRMVEAVLKLKREGKIGERLIIQTGHTPVKSALPAGVEAYSTLPFSEMKDILRRSNIVVCHGGTGSIITALQAGCRTVVFPRQFSLGEHYDEHQSEISKAMEARGLVAVVQDEQDLPGALEQVRGKDPKVATTDTSELAAFLESKLRAWGLEDVSHGARS